MPSDDSNAHVERKSRLESVFESLQRAARTPFVKALVSAASQQLGGQSITPVLTPGQAHAISLQLNSVLDGLISACIEQKKRLQGGKMPWERVNSARVMSSLTALDGITSRLARALDDFAATAQPTTNRPTNRPQTTSTPSSNTGPSLAVVRLGHKQEQVTPDQIQRVAEGLRNLHDYVIEVANQIRASIAGSAGANPFALDGAIAEATMLVAVLRDASPRLWQMLGTQQPPS